MVKTKSNQSNDTLLSSDASNQVVKARSETVISVGITNTCLLEGIVPNTQIAEDIYLCSSIVKVNKDNNSIITTILNASEKDHNIENLMVTLEPLPESTQMRIIQESNYESNRLNELIKTINTDHLNDEEYEEITKLCMEYNDIFYLEGDNLTYTDLVEHEIHTSSNVPINAKNYRYPEALKEEVERQVNEMLEQNIIKPSYSPWNSPVWVVPKKSTNNEKKWRVVIDYRKLNNITIGDSYPLPNIEEILDQLGCSKYFSTLDLTSGFHQIKMHPRDAPKTAFSVPSGHYEFNRMPFGLKNSPATFQRLMNVALSGLQNTHRCLVYLDDIVVFSDSLTNHIKKLRDVFDRLQEFNLKLEPKKCQFLRHETVYLGHLITDKGVQPDPNKVTAIKNLSVPKNVKQIKSFLGLVGYYRRFVGNFSQIAQPLTKLLKKNAEFKWTSLQQQSFEKFKEILCSSPILQFPDFSKEFTLTTDASNYAIGAVLSQGEQNLPVAYYSRTLSKAEQNYDTLSRECLAVISAVKHFRPYLFGRKFKIITDNSALTWLDSVIDPSSRLIRWRLTLLPYNYYIVHKPGKLNRNADALSRLPIDKNNEEITKTKNENEIVKINKIESKQYKDFLKALETSVISYDKINDFNDDLITAKDNIAIFLSLDLENHNKNLENIFKKYNHLSSLNKDQLELFNVHAIKENDKQIYYVFYKQHYWDSANYSDIFDCLIKLKNELIKSGLKSISFNQLGDTYDNLHWSKIRSIIRYVFKGTSIVVNIYYNLLITPKKEEIAQIIKECHDPPGSGHPGFHKTYKRVKQVYKWKNMKKDIAEYVKNCKSCQENKLVRRKNKMPMEITTTSKRPLEKIFLDIVGPLPTSINGNKYILTVQDDLSKFSQAYAIPNREALTVAKNLVSNFICKFGIPECMLTDQGQEFNSNLMKNISKLFKMKHVTTSAYRPQTNGALERSHLTLADYLKHYLENQDEWEEYLDFAMFSYNTSVHSTTKFTPYELMYGYKPLLPSSITRSPEIKYTYDDYLDELKFRLQKSHEIAHEHMLNSKQVNKNYYDKKSNPLEIEIGDQVYLLNEQVKPGISKKLTPRYSGPYFVTAINSNTNCTIKIKNKNVVVHKDRLKKAIVSNG